MKLNKKEKVYEFITTYSSEFYHDEYPKFTTNFLSQKLGMQRTNLSSILNQLVKEGKLIKENGRPVMYQFADPSSQGEQVFEQLIGYDQSLKEAVSIAKAAVLYPKGKSNILLTAERGCGARFFAEIVFQFAVKSGVVRSNVNLLSLNCKDYKDNPDFRRKKIFGSETEAGLLKQSEGGIFLIKNINMLPEYERRQLFTSKERGMLICGIEPLIDQEIYESLKANTEFEIKIPLLNQRPLGERFQLIQKFFMEESEDIGKNPETNANILRALLLYEAQENIVSLKKDIHTGCVNCYARERQGKRKFIEMVLSDFPKHIRKGMIYYKVHKDEMDELVSDEYIYAFTDKTMLKKQAQKDDTDRNIYQAIDAKKRQYKKQQMDEEEIDVYVSAHLEEDFLQYYNGLVEKIATREKLENIVSQKLIGQTEHFLKLAATTLHTSYDEKMLCALCMHINACLIRKDTKQRISNEEIGEIIASNPKEYELAKEFIKSIEIYFQIQMKVDEIVFLILFLNHGREKRKPQVVTLIAMHGDETASALAQTVYALSEEENVYAFDLALDKNMKDAYEELKQVIMEIHQGRGIIFIYDMGSLRTMAESIAVETDISIRYVEAPVTLMGIACSNKAGENEDLDDIYDYLQENFRDTRYDRDYDGKNRMIVIASQDYDEAALIQNYITEKMEWNHIKIKTVVTNHEGYLFNTLDKLSNEGIITAIVGTYNPLLAQYRFIDAKRLMETEKISLEEYLQLQETEDETGITEAYEYLAGNFPDLNMAKIEVFLTDFIQQAEYLFDLKLDENKKIGLIIHIVCLLDRMQKKYTPSVSFIASSIIKKHGEMVHEVKKILEPLEKEFNVYINDTEIATIISIIRES
ncbi:MAG: PRD domain-containing protein [Lachnospiraceae bacterium]|nr:PRD domain-containing protein [Lachnospiraceae bacterium]